MITTKQSAFCEIEPLYWSFYIEIQKHPAQILLRNRLSSNTDIIKELANNPHIRNWWWIYLSFRISRRKTILLQDNIPFVVGGNKNVLGIFSVYVTTKENSFRDRNFELKIILFSEINSPLPIKQLKYVPLETKLLGFVSIPGHYNKDSSIITKQPHMGIV